MSHPPATLDHPRTGAAAPAGTGGPVPCAGILSVLFLGVAAGTQMSDRGLQAVLSPAIQQAFGVGDALGVILLVTNLCSLPAAGAIDRLLRRRLQARARPAVMAAGAALSLPCAALLGLAADTHQALATVAVFLLLTCIANALIPTMLQDLLPADLRARCFAIYSFVIAAFCSLGPVLSGAVSDCLADGNLLLAIGAVAVPALLVAMLSAGLSAWRPGERSHLATAATAA